ncbi:hypothetical protein [Paracidovorax citrulli]
MKALERGLPYALALWSVRYHIMLHAIVERTPSDRSDDFHLEAERRFATLMAGGSAIAWEEMRAYLLLRASGNHPPRPIARKLSELMPMVLRKGSNASRP